MQVRSSRESLYWRVRWCRLDGRPAALLPEDGPRKRNRAALAPFGAGSASPLLHRMWMLLSSAVAIITPLPRAASLVLHHSPAPRLSYAVPHLRCAESPEMSMPLPNIWTLRPLTRLSTAALVLNAVASATNGLFYLTPLRNTVLRNLFGIDGTDSRSPVVGAFQFLGGLHAAIAIQCVMALVGLRSWKEMLVGMAILHAIQAAVGLCRVLDHRRAGVTDMQALLGAGGGPAGGAVVLGCASLVAVL